MFFFHTLLCAGVGGQIRRLLGVACWLGEQQTKCPLHLCPSVTSLRSIIKGHPALPPDLLAVSHKLLSFPHSFFPSTILHKTPWELPAQKEQESTQKKLLVQNYIFFTPPTPLFAEKLFGVLGSAASCFPSIPNPLSRIFSRRANTILYYPHHHPIPNV